MATKQSANTLESPDEGEISYSTRDAQQFTEKTKETSSEGSGGSNSDSNNHSFSQETLPDTKQKSIELKAGSSSDSSDSEWEQRPGNVRKIIPMAHGSVISRKKIFTEKQKEDLARWKAELKAIKSRSLACRPEQAFKVNRKYVALPSKKIEGDTPIRPFSKELLWYDPKVSGTASEVFDLIFPNSSRTPITERPWIEGNFSAPASYCKIHDDKNQKILRSYGGLSEAERTRQKLLKVLDNLQELLWMMHNGRIDQNLEKTFSLMTEKFYCRFDRNRRLQLITKDDFSLIWNRSILTENSSVMGQREAGWRLRPVFIDGLAFLHMFFPFRKSTLPIIYTKILLEILMHFILDGHKTVMYLPTFYKNSVNHIDNVDVFKYLGDMKLIAFVDARSRKSVEQKTLKDAEKSFGIIVSPSETVSTGRSIQCFPTVNRYSKKSDEFVLTTFFEDTDALAARFDKEVDRKTRKLFWTVMGVPDYKSDSEDDYGTDVFEEESNDAVNKKENSVKGSDSGIGSLASQSKSESVLSTGSSVRNSNVAADKTDETEISGYETACSETSSDSFSHDKLIKAQSYQDFANKCRLYSYSEKQQINTRSHQLALKQQVHLVSSFVHFTVFHFQRNRQIQVFFLLISRHLPDLLPDFMKKSSIYDVGAAIENMKNDNNMYYFPMYSISKL